MYGIYELKSKQAQKEGASVADISAGLAYSVIKNALFKVIKVSDASELGKNIVVQGGTFYNNAVLRSFEKIANCEAVRPDIAGIMGAFGAALIARERYHTYDCKETTMLSIEDIENLTYETSMAKCQRCANHCRLTINKFTGGRRSSPETVVSGVLERKRPTPIFQTSSPIKTSGIFGYKPLPKEEAPHGTIGLPRVLNMYEDYPLWFTFFTELGFSVVLSPSSRERSMRWESNPSQASPSAIRQSLPTAMWSG